MYKDLDIDFIPQSNSFFDTVLKTIIDRFLFQFYILLRISHPKLIFMFLSEILFKFFYFFIYFY